MAQRLARAKRKIKAARIPYRVPEDHELPERLRPVLAVVYLVYNAGLTTPRDLLRRLGRNSEADAAYERAAAIAPTEAERDFLRLGGRASR
jgi:RNA polymerase sigma-70 factor (ECF subfamily)